MPLTRRCPAASARYHRVIDGVWKKDDIRNCNRKQNLQRSSKRSAGVLRLANQQTFNLEGQRKRIDKRWREGLMPVVEQNKLKRAFARGRSRPRLSGLDFVRADERR